MSDWKNYYKIGYTITLLAKIQGYKELNVSNPQTFCLCLGWYASICYPDLMNYV